MSPKYDVTDGPYTARIPILVYTIACMMFGFPPNQSRYYWWAVIMEGTATTSQLMGVSALYLVALAAYIVGAETGSRYSHSP